MANPVNGIYRPPDTLPMSAVASSAATPSPQQGLDASSLRSGILRDEGEDDEDDGLRMGIEVGAECVESRRQRTMPASSSRSSLSNVSAVSGAGHRPSMTLIVPATSYSSSEEEDFFDANEYNETPSSTATPTIGGLHPFVEQQSLEECPGNSSQQDDSNERPSSVPPKVHDDGTLDYDALYEDESDPENGIENQGTVISHLISQVKIGMDLTKVVLPTFILERRSLLEMYADYFAHPDLFVKIADFKDPKDRMVQVLRWYVSAYHAGRKSAVAKKPYNPIIGEIFQCYWDIPDTVDDDQSPVTDGPIPWCSKNQLTFIAEQVSHHPPISAFYAEHYNRRISFCAHVWTKSKFLGLSVGVHNIGQGCISVLDYDEEYIITFPNGYGRSILTTPWIELGGSVVISCAKTGYNATVEFLTKPFYGGKKNRIIAEVYKPNEKKSFLTIAGEWNGLMEAKWADGRQEVFVDVNKINVVKKKVRPIVQQEDYESRKLWKEVTAGLRLKDIDRATNAKFELEQKQREEAKIRKEEGLAWETKVFHLAGENWVYKEPLVKRLPSKQNLL